MIINFLYGVALNGKNVKICDTHLLAQSAARKVLA